MRKVLATDLDGTLFYPKKRICLIDKKNLRVIRNHLQNDGHVILVTGRNYPFIKKVIEKIGYPVDVIACNGAYVKASDTLLKESIISKEHSLALFDLILTQMDDLVLSLFGKDGSMVMFRHGVSFFKNLLYLFVYKYQGTYAEKYVKGKKEVLKMIENIGVYKFLIYFGVGEKGKNNALRAAKIFKERVPGLEISIEGSAMEITSEGCNKAEGLKLLCEHYGYHEDDIIVVGDSGNDITMFDHYPHSFCMSHAYKEVQSHAAHVLEHFYDIESYLLKEKQ